jgi:hypothetical protein
MTPQQRWSRFSTVAEDIEYVRHKLEQQLDRLTREEKLALRIEQKIPRLLRELKLVERHAKDIAGDAPKSHAAPKRVIQFTTSPGL